MDFKRCFLLALIASFSTVLLILFNTQGEYVIQMRNYSVTFPSLRTANKFHEPLPRVVGLQNRTVTTTQSTKEKVINDKKQKQNVLRASSSIITTLPSTLRIVTTQSTAATTITTTPATTSASTTVKIVPKTQYYICTSFTGGIGNQMFEFAAGFGTAFSKKMKMVVGENDLINKVFELKSNAYLVVSKDRHECRGAKSRGEAKASAYDQNLVNFKSDASYHLGLYLQSWEYFNDSTVELKKQLVFREPTRTHVKQKTDSIVKSHKYNSRADVVLIAIHVRRGDMVNNKHGYNVATREYIVNAMSHFANISNKIFVVCSNDIAWSKANIPKDKGPLEIMTGNSREEDMALMASCDHMIMTVGSFSWWTGWFINGNIFYYKWPAKEGSNLRNQYSKSYWDYFYPNWTGL